MIRAVGMTTRTSPLFLRDEELDRALELLLVAERGLAARTRAQAGARPGPEIDLLWLVHRRPGASAAELGRLLGAAKQTTSRQLRALETAGLLAREADGADRRRRRLGLTERGAALVAAIGERRRQGLRRAFKSAGPEAVAGFQRVLDALAEATARRPPGRATD
jgi:DNA-binding MarR family transcriptional regulator